MLSLQCIDDVSTKTINKLYKDKVIQYQTTKSGYYLLRNDKQTALVHAVKDELHLVSTKDYNFQGVKPQDVHQSCMFHAFNTFDCAVALGLAGSGKTYCAVAYALHQLFRKEMNIVLLKPTVFIGKKSNAMGAVKGDKREKLEPYISSYLTHFHKLLGKSSDHFLYQFEEDKKLEFEAVELCRGRHFENSIVIVDEAQNLDTHELLSLVSRVADSSKLFLLGDSQQIDTGAKWKDTGLYNFLNSEAFNDSEYATGIRLKKTYRGVLAELASSVIYELDNT